MTKHIKADERNPFGAQLTLTQIACMTKLTRRGERDMRNKKPYRSKALKQRAAKTAYKGKNGAWRSTTPLLYHSGVI